MSLQQDQAGSREVFRSTGSVILWWAWIVIAIALLADVAVQGSGRLAAVAVVLVAAVTGVMYGCALRPRVVADAAGITVENPLRDHLVRWGAVTKVDAVNALRVHCAAAPGASQGTILHSWAVQSSPRSARAAQLRQAGGHSHVRAAMAATRPRRPRGRLPPSPPRGSWTSGPSGSARQAPRAGRRRRAGPGHPSRRWRCRWRRSSWSRSPRASPPIPRHRERLPEGAGGGRRAVRRAVRPQAASAPRAPAAPPCHPGCTGRTGEATGSRSRCSWTGST